MPPPPRTSIVGSLCACISRSARRAASSPSRLADLADLASSVATPRAPASSPDRARSPVVRHTPRANSRATCAGDARTPGGATRASDALARATASRAACHCAGDCRSRAAVSGDTARGTCCARDSGTPRAIHDAAADAASDPVVARDATRRIIASQPGAEGTAAGGGGGISISRHVHVSSCVNQDRGSPRGAPVQVRYAGCARGGYADRGGFARGRLPSSPAKAYRICGGAGSPRPVSRKRPRSHEPSDFDEQTRTVALLVCVFSENLESKWCNLNENYVRARLLVHSSSSRNLRRRV